MSYLEGYNGAQGAPMKHPGYLTGRYYSTVPNQIGSAAAPNAVDTLYLYPFAVFAPVAITSLVLRTGTGGAGSSVKTGIWANNPATNKPSGAPLIVDNTGAATTSSNTNVSISASGSLQPGFYWMGAKFTGTLPTVSCIQAANQYMSYLMGFDTSGLLIANAISMSDTFSNNMPTIATNQSFTVVGVGGVPAIAFGT